MKAKECNSECLCADCKGKLAIRLAARNAKLNASGKKANELLKKAGFRFMSRGKPKAVIKPGVKESRDRTMANPRIELLGSKRYCQGFERIVMPNGDIRVTNDTRRNYRVQPNGAVIGGFDARYEDETISEITTKAYKK
jgi:hypothetical protein